MKLETKARITLFLFLSIFAVVTKSKAQGDKKNILFVVDGSQSMLASWGKVSKMDVAIDNINSVVKLISKKDNVQCALRMFGNHSPFANKDCTDSKLEISFGNGDVYTFYQFLQKVYPKGITPISYALEQSANDFPNKNGENIIVLLTDGEESCDRDPCTVIKALKSKNIRLKSFVIGIGLEKKIEDKFKCIGNFYNVTNSAELSSVFNAIINNVLQNDFLTVQLLDTELNPNETDVNFTLHNNKNETNNYYHSLVNNRPDSIKVDFNATYDIIAHTKPTVSKSGIVMNTLDNNEIQLNTPQGVFKTSSKGSNKSTPQHRIVTYLPNENKSLFIQEYGEQVSFLTGKYKAIITTLPFQKFDNIEVVQSKMAHLQVPQYGSVSISSSMPVYAFVMAKTAYGWSRVYTLPNNISNHILQLQPGKYKIIARSFVETDADLSKIIPFEIESNTSQTLKIY